MKFVHTTLHHLSLLASFLPSLLVVHTSKIDFRIERLALEIAFGCKPNTGDDVEVERSACGSTCGMREREKKVDLLGWGSKR